MYFFDFKNQLVLRIYSCVERANSNLFTNEGHNLKEHRNEFSYGEHTYSIK